MINTVRYYIHVAQATYEKDLARLTMEIVEPTVVQVSKDVRVTFADQLGTIGK